MFENAFAEYHGIKHSIATTSGTTALHTALTSLGVGPGDEVIVPDLTFISTASVVLQTGAKVVFADIDPETLNISTADLKAKINEHTRAVMVVHLYGLPANMQAILAITDQFNLPVIEDCAQSHGAVISGRKVGTFGRLSCFSFYQTKNMSCGEGGMIITNDDALADHCRSLARHGLIGENLALYDYDRLGYNYAMTELQAAIGMVQLNKLEKLNSMRRDNAKRYRKALVSLPLHFQPDNPGHVNHCLTCQLPKQLHGMRDEFIRAVRAEGAIVNCLYPLTLSQTRIFRDQSTNTPVAHAVAESLFNLYTNPDLDPHFVDVCAAAICKVLVEVLP
ncbi:MAG: DegT/DnrJ/EryC1/StrS family aminotransferase [Candidatus Buchananbacteria bacterium]|nr:DegT/DnrJ/EryC1/StrS family aminotransferase [Candidatus Buchananbacteria bacterium]